MYFKYKNLRPYFKYLSAIRYVSAKEVRNTNKIDIFNKKNISRILKRLITKNEGEKMNKLLDLNKNISVINVDQKNFGKKEALFIQVVSNCQPIKSKEQLRQKVEAAGLSYNDFYSIFEFLVKINFLRFQKESWYIDPRVIKIIDKEYPKQITRFDVIEDLNFKGNVSCNGI